MNEKMEGRFANLKVMMKSLLEGQSRATTPRERGECSGHKDRENPNLEGKREKHEVEILGIMKRDHREHRSIRRILRGVMSIWRLEMKGGEEI